MCVGSDVDDASTIEKEDIKSIIITSMTVCGMAFCEEEGRMVNTDL